jgi:hypothetical protein
MCGAIPLLLSTPSWRGAQLKHRDKFSFYFTFVIFMYVGNRKCYSGMLVEAEETPGERH